jgi:hypothetical protein
MQKLAFVVLASLSTAALAGDHYAPEVFAYSDTFRRVLYTSGYGSVAGAAASDDRRQYISCSTSKYSYEGGVSGRYGYCLAVDADNNVASCVTQDAEMIEVMASINETSLISFAGTDGECTGVYVSNSSQAL